MLFQTTFAHSTEARTAQRDRTAVISLKWLYFNIKKSGLYSQQNQSNNFCRNQGADQNWEPIHVLYIVFEDTVKRLAHC